MTARVLITGVAGAIGAATAQAFAEAGWSVFGTDRRPPTTAVPLAGFVEADLADPDAAVEAVLALLGEGLLGALVNNGATQPLGDVSQTDTATWDVTLRTNVVSPARLSGALAPKLRGGAIVNVASVHAMATTPGRVAYATSKAALVGLTRSMALELAPDVRVNAVVPGAVQSPMLTEGIAPLGLTVEDLAATIPTGRVAEPADIAAVILFLCSPAARQITGQPLVVDGGALARLPGA